MLATFSLHSVVNDAGSYAGLASLIGLALLVLLYFAQARELRRLSDWIDDEEERRAASPAPLPRATVLAPGLAPPPAASGAITTAVPGVRRVAVPPATAAATSVSAGVAAGAAGPAPGTAVTAPGSAAGAPLPAVAAPGNAAAPGLDAEPVHEAAAGAAADRADEPAEPVLAPATAAARSETAPAPEHPVGPAAVPLAGPQIPSAEPDAGRLAAAAAAESAALAAVSPRAPDEGAVQEPAPLAPSTAAAARPRFPPPPGVRVQPIAGSAGAMMAAGGPPAALEADRDPLAIEPTRRGPGGRGPGGGDPDDPRGRNGARPPHSPWPALRLLLVAIVIVAVLIFAVAQLFGGSSTPPARTGTSQTTATHTATGSRTAATAPPPAPDTITVSVLNGTTVTHLASGAWTRLAARGFKEGAVADAPAQDHVRTIVGYITGRRTAALEVAHDLGLSPADAQTVDSASLAAGSAGGLHPQVVVTLGSEYANSQ